MIRAAAFIGLGALCFAGAPLLADTTMKSDEAQSEETMASAELFEDNCGACHGEGGVGTPGIAPPLTRPEFWTELGDNAPLYMAGMMTHGMARPLKIDGERYMGMPAVPNDSDEELAVIGTHVLKVMGETDFTLTAADISKARDEGPKGNDLLALRPKTK